MTYLILLVLALLLLTPLALGVWLLAKKPRRTTAGVIILLLTTVLYYLAYPFIALAFILLTGGDFS